MSAASEMQSSASAAVSKASSTKCRPVNRDGPLQASIDSTLELDVAGIADQAPNIVTGETRNSRKGATPRTTRAFTESTGHIQEEVIKVTDDASRSATRKSTVLASTAQAGKRKSMASPGPSRPSKCRFLALYWLERLPTLICLIAPVDKRTSKSHESVAELVEEAEPSRQRERRTQSRPRAEVAARDPAKSPAPKRREIAVGFPEESDEEDLSVEELDMREVSTTR